MKTYKTKIALLTGALFLSANNNDTEAKVDYSDYLNDEELNILRPLNENLSPFLVGHRSHSSHGSHGSHGSHRSSSPSQKKPVPNYDNLGQPKKPPKSVPKPPKNIPKNEKRMKIIEQVQFQLKHVLEIYSGPIDGLMGPETRKAVEKYQKIRGLDITGKIDTNTLNALGIAGF
jgi:His-Xaa-Ser repeat protein HxsA